MNQLGVSTSENVLTKNNPDDTVLDNLRGTFLFDTTDVLRIDTTSHHSYIIFEIAIESTEFNIYIYVYMNSV